MLKDVRRPFVVLRGLEQALAHQVAQLTAMFRAARKYRLDLLGRGREFDAVLVFVEDVRQVSVRLRWQRRCKREQQNDQCHKNLSMFSLRNFASAGLLAAPAVCPHSEGIGSNFTPGMNAAS